MRDPARIPLVLEAIRAVWEEHPDWRLCQLLQNAAPHRHDLYSLEDDDLLALLSRRPHDAMKRLAGIEPLPRGERLARFIEHPGGTDSSRDVLWERLFDGSRTLTALDSLFALEDGVYPPRCVPLKEHAERWRTYAAPLRAARDRLWGTRREVKQSGEGRE